MRRSLVTALVACGALAAAAPASAATRYVSVGGLNSGTCTTEATACNYIRR